MAEAYTNLQKTGKYSEKWEQRAADEAAEKTKHLLDELKLSMKAGTFARGYLMCGEEGYLIRYYKNALKKAIIGDDDMNYTYYTGAFDMQDFMSIADTMPFFGERRLILVENSGYFAAGRGGKAPAETAQLEEYLPTMPDTTFVIFAENSVDKRFKLYKTFSKLGKVCQFNYMDRPWIINWMVTKARAAGCSISKGTCNALMDRVGIDLNILSNELDKLTSYCGPGSEITVSDLAELATGRLEDAIFEMITNVLCGRMDKAMNQYADLLGLKEPPIKLLVIIGKQCAQAIAVKEARAAGLSDKEITAMTGAGPYQINKYTSDLGRCPISKLAAGVSLAAEMDYAIKSGNMEDRLALEVLLTKLGSVK